MSTTDQFTQAVLDSIEIEALQQGIQGVAAVLIHDGVERTDHDQNASISYRVVNRIERDPDPEKGPNDTGTNYLAVVLTKVAEMVSTGFNSGKSNRQKKTGETGFRGGIVMVDFNKRKTIYVAFSGGTEQQDIYLATAGVQKFHDMK